MTRIRLLGGPDMAWPLPFRLCGVAVSRRDSKQMFCSHVQDSNGAKKDEMEETS